MHSGKVYFVEPIHANLESLDSAVRQALSSADVVLHEASAPAEILALTRPSARQHNLGAPGTVAATPAQEIRARLVTYATQGLKVVRLTAPGPAGVESTRGESDVLLECGIQFEILSEDAAGRPESPTLAASA